MLFLSALLQVLSYPPFDLGWLAWVAHVPWLAALQRTPSPGLAFTRSYLVGLLFFTGTIWWVGHVTVIGAILLIAYLALFFGAWGLFAYTRFLARLPGHGSCRRSPPPCSPNAARGGGPPPGVTRGRTEVLKQALRDLELLAGLPAAWVALEYLRSTLLSGFGWNLLSHTQWNWIELIQFADLTGVYGVSFLIVLVNVALYLAFSVQRSAYRKAAFSVQRAAAALIPAGLYLLAALLYGNFLTPVVSLEERFRVCVLQGNIPQAQKWDEAYEEAIWKRYEELTAQAVRMQPDLIVWPETALPGFLEDTQVRARLDAIARSAGCPLLVGAATEKCATGRMHNSAVLLDPQGEELERYDKIHLVPFGEFIPLRPILGWIQRMVPIGDFAPGQAFTIFHPSTRQPVNPSTAFSVLICFEDLFPELARGFVREGAQGLFVITNDAWFKQSAASLQHLQASVFRAIENRVWVARAANTGWSGFVDPFGRRMPPPGQIPRFQPGVAEAELMISPWLPSPYVRWGDWFPAGCLILTAMAFFPRRRPL